MAAATVVLVHGMCGAPSAWSRVVPVLDALGVPNVAVQLPSCLPDSEVDDANSVRSLLDECGGAVVLAGHSFGGMVLTEVGTHPSVRHLVYVDAEILDIGEAVFEVMDGRVAEAFTACMNPEGDTLAFDADELSRYFTSRGWSAVDIQEFMISSAAATHSCIGSRALGRGMANGSVNAHHLRRQRVQSRSASAFRVASGRSRRDGRGPLPDLATARRSRGHLGWRCTECGVTGLVPRTAARVRAT